jgi:N-acetyl sugar amidotransferase
MSYTVCKRCVMDTSDPEIFFDQDGVCSGCKVFEKRLKAYGYRRNASELAWSDKVSFIKETSRHLQYDCLVGVSGGVDSSYAAYLCKQSGLRCLLFHMDNGWNSDIAVSNIKSLAERLDYDFVSHVIDWPEFREVQLAFLRAFSVDLEMPTDIAIHATLCSTAKQFGIKHIIAGGNLATEGMLPERWGYHKYKDMRMYRHIVSKYSKTRIKNVPVIGFFEELSYRFIYGLKFHYVLNHFPFDKNLVREFLIKNLGWKDYGGKHFESHITAFWQGFVMPKKFGLDYRRPTLSVQIINGKIDRSSALEQLQTEAFPTDRLEFSLDYVARKFELTKEQLVGYLEQTPKTYVDFPNNSRLLRFLYGVYLGVTRFRALLPGVSRR